MHHLLLLLILGTLTFRSGLSENITAGSEIFASKSPSAWISRSARFAFGFFPEGRGFRVGIWLQTSPNITVVWVANRDDEPVSRDAKLQAKFTNEVRFLLLADGQARRSQPISDLPDQASSASLLDTGNLIIYNSLSETMWRSFDFPTDTIVSNQALLTGNQLYSGVSERNRSSGSFRLNNQKDGNLVLYPKETYDVWYNAYWASASDRIPAGNHTLLLAGDGFLSFRYDNGSLLYNLTGVQSSDPKFTYRATLGADGFFRLYSHDFSRNGASNIVGKWPLSDDPCVVKGICGYNSYCSSIDDQHNCSCVPGFHFIDPNDWTRGCEPNRCGVSSSANESILVLKNEKVQWLGYDYSPHPASTQNDCADSCLADRNCEAAFYGSEGDCRKQRMPLTYGKVVEVPPYVTLIRARNCNSSVDVTAGSSGSSTTTKAVLFVGGVLAAVAAVALAVASLLFYRSRRRSYTRLSRKGNLRLTEEVSLPMFSYDELRIATDGFNEELGRGAFGTVYKGTDGDKLIAVKRLEKVQIEEGEREFLTEMRSIGRTHHRNLVRLLGVCHEGQTRLLVYEYMSNGSLACFIFNDHDHDDRVLLPRLHWNDRVRVAVDVARGILYLHEDCDPHIIHCDIKPQNILMDASWTAKISDFGLAKLLTPDQTRTFTGVRGTRGYLAPEWYKNMPISVKADVYSFGMVLLETICCRRNVDIEVPNEEMILTEWVYRCLRYGELLKLVKAEEEEEVEKRMLERMVMVGLWCIQEEPALRPTMKMVMSMLEGNLEIPIPPAPDSRSY